MTEQELEQMEMDIEGTHTCPKCNADTPNERATVLNVMTCRDCTPQGFSPKAFFSSDEREGEGGTFVIVFEQEAFKNAKQANDSLEESDAEETVEPDNEMEAVKKVM